jgi:hypothetical protein
MSWRTEQNGFIKTWAQDVRNSYKVRLKYVLVPKGVQTDVRFIDTPYRFQSYQEAREYAKELFPCYSYAVEGSPDQPNFNETQFVQRTTKEELQNTKYYDVYGVKRSYMKEPLDSREMNEEVEEVVTKRTNKKSVPLTKLTVEEQIEKKLDDIEILRLKLNEKESELIQMKNSISSNNSKINNASSRNTVSNNSKKANVISKSELPPPYTNSNNSNSIKKTNVTSKGEQANSSKKTNVTSRNASANNSKKTNVKSTKNSPPPYDSLK